MRIDRVFTVADVVLAEGPGGYTFRDYLKVGLPLFVLAGLLVVALVPAIWGLSSGSAGAAGVPP